MEVNYSFFVARYRMIADWFRSVAQGLGSADLKVPYYVVFQVAAEVSRTKTMLSGKQNKTKRASQK